MSLVALHDIAMSTKYVMIVNLITLDSISVILYKPNFLSIPFCVQIFNLIIKSMYIKNYEKHVLFDKPN